jgi:hypothetical protein
MKFILDSFTTIYRHIPTLVTYDWITATEDLHVFLCSEVAGRGIHRQTRNRVGESRGFLRDHVIAQPDKSQTPRPRKIDLIAPRNP